MTHTLSCVILPTKKAQIVVLRSVLAECSDECFSTKVCLLCCTRVGMSRQSAAVPRLCLLLHKGVDRTTRGLVTRGQPFALIGHLAHADFFLRFGVFVEVSNSETFPPLIIKVMRPLPWNKCLIIPMMLLRCSPVLVSRCSKWTTF